MKNGISRSKKNTGFGDLMKEKKIEEKEKKQPSKNDPRNTAFVAG